MDLGLNGKRALVTGSTAGIGYATAQALAREGAHVIINGRTQRRVDEAVARLRGAASGARVAGIAADVSGAEGCARIASAYPDLDILVNNMGIFEPKPFVEISDEDWLRFFESNVMSGVRLSRHYVRGMQERNWGRIVFVSSESGLQIPVEMIHYGVTKTAQIAVARGLAESLAGTNVTVNSVLPGPTASEGVVGFVAQLAASSGKSAAQLQQEFFQHARPTSLLRRFEEPAEIGDFIAYVCSARASAITGAALRADGGVVRAIG
jgi:NAD(P)-dependent dehydrogenase (short-subunit alcohol dehydrogenase family)